MRVQYKRLVLRDDTKSVWRTATLCYGLNPEPTSWAWSANFDLERVFIELESYPRMHMPNPNSVSEVFIECIRDPDGSDFPWKYQETLRKWDEKGEKKGDWHRIKSPFGTIIQPADLMESGESVVLFADDAWLATSENPKQFAAK